MRAKPAIAAFKSAMGSLPSSNLSSTQMIQKKQYEDGLREAEELLHPKTADLVHISKDKLKETPMERASEILKEIGMYPVPTSVGMPNSLSLPVSNLKT